MSAGKIAAQSFQAAQRLFAAAIVDTDLASLLERWQRAGTTTRVRIALSPMVFGRACRELAGVVMIDEGMNEVEPDSATCFATWPIEGDLPRILRHKRMPVLNAPVVHTSIPGRVSLSGRAAGFMPRRSRVRIPPRPLAREAELAQHLAPRSEEVAGSNPAASMACGP